VGFDLAGPESGFPADQHVKAFRTIRRQALSVTIHAGEVAR
jgi:adenosine deaminase